jgi:uncharacterized protein (TIGR03083 family)
MASTAIKALEADRVALLEICAGLTDADWKTESGCAGWSVQDVVAHLGALFWMVVDPSTLPDASGLPTERAQDVYVEARRSLGPAQVLADYETVSAEGIERLTGLESQDFELALEDFGTYPAWMLPNAYCFDHYTHIRADLFAPRGPLTGQPPPSDERRLAPAVKWIATALPQQNADLLASLTGSVEIEVRGPGGRTIRFGWGEPAAWISCDAPALAHWITQRATWEETGTEAAGDQRALALARKLKVF